MKLNQKTKIAIFYLLIVVLFNYAILTKFSYILKNPIVYIALSIAICATGGFLLWYFMQKKELKPETVFLFVAIGMGLFYVLATPMFKGHDEKAHWYKAYATSLGIWTETHHTETGKNTVELPENVKKAAEDQGDFKTATYQSQWGNWYQLAQKEAKENTAKVDVDVTVTSSYPPIEFAPQAIGIAVARTIGLDIYLQAYVRKNM